MLRGLVVENVLLREASIEVMVGRMDVLWEVVPSKPGDVSEGGSREKPIRGIIRDKRRNTLEFSRGQGERPAS